MPLKLTVSSFPLWLFHTPLSVVSHVSLYSWIIEHIRISMLLYCQLGLYKEIVLEQRQNKIEAYISTATQNNTDRQNINMTPPFIMWWITSHRLFWIRVNQEIFFFLLHFFLYPQEVTMCLFYLCYSFSTHELPLSDS